MIRKLGLLTLSLTFLAACASAPETFEEPEPVAERQMPAPMPVTPAPTRPVTQDNLGPTTQPFIGPIPGSTDDFIYYTGGSGRIYFGYDQFDLSAEARDVLRRQADWLGRYPQVTAVIEGNADERGTREYNLALGARRAESVKSFLVSLGVPPIRLTTVSYGKERPIDARSTEQGWAANRNAHTNLISGTIG